VKDAFADLSDAPGNTALGHADLSNLDPNPGTVGYQNAAAGFNALFNNFDGYGNTATGFRSLYNNDNDHTGAGWGNTATGDQSMLNNVDGFANTGIGHFALMNNSIGSENTAVGKDSMSANQTGIRNTAVGVSSLQSTTAGGNSGFGYRALAGNVSGTNNTAIGFQAGTGISGNNNTVIGANANVGGGLTNASAIGSGASVTAGNTMVLGSTNVSVVIGATTAADKLQVVGDIRVGTSGTNGCIKNFSGAGIVGTCSSDIRLKQNIQPFFPVLGKLIHLQPVSYEWRSDEHPEYHFGSERANGLIAQEVEKVFPDMVATDERGYKAVNYSELPLLLLQAVRELKAENDSLRQERASDQQHLLETLKQQQQIIRQLQSDLDGLKGRSPAENGRGK
jgi:hypothetical protein